MHPSGSSQTSLWILLLILISGIIVTVVELHLHSTGRWTLVHYADMPELGLYPLLDTRPTRPLTLLQWKSLCARQRAPQLCLNKVERVVKAQGSHCHYALGDEREECVRDQLNQHPAFEQALEKRKTIDKNMVAFLYLESCRSYEATNSTCPKWVEEEAPLTRLVPSAYLAEAQNWTACSAEGIWTDFFRCPEEPLTYAQSAQVVYTAVCAHPFPMYFYMINDTHSAVTCISGDGTCPDSAYSEYLQPSQFLPTTPAAMVVDPKARPVPKRMTYISEL